MRTAVVLPAPFGPRMPSTSPASTATVRSSTATSDPKSFAIPRASTTGVMPPRILPAGWTRTRLPAQDERRHEAGFEQRGPREACENRRMRVLVVEDELQMASLIRHGLLKEGLAVDIAASGEDSLWMVGARRLRRDRARRDAAGRERLRDLPADPRQGRSRPGADADRARLGRGSRRRPRLGRRRLPRQAVRVRGAARAPARSRAARRARAAGRARGG